MSRQSTENTSSVCHGCVSRAGVDGCMRTADTAVAHSSRTTDITWTRTRAILGAVLGVLLGISTSTAQPENTLTLRGGATPPAGEVVACSIEGVVVESPVTGRVIVGWERVRSVSGEHAEEAEAFAEIADQAWRAISRLQRGDIPAAEPVLEGLFVLYRDRTGPTAAAINGGLLRCRLERGAHTLAVGAWLAWLHASSDDAEAAWYDTLSLSRAASAAPTTDPETGLLPGLPPIWLDLPAVRVFGDAPSAGAAFGEREQELAELYRHAARAQHGDREPMPRLTSADPAVRLVWDIVAAQSRSDQERATGRKAIKVRLRKEPVGWLDAWLRVGLGRSLLLEDETAQRQRGVIELLRVRITHERDAPYLAGLALAEAAVALRELGDDTAATMLRRELLDLFPDHPAAGWEPIMLWNDSLSARMERDPPRQPSVVESRKPHG
ncbi:hypothetical protein MNBD_PLANCTO03-1157 [hydrothermal vent metagenome]|uniref:Uncharacterized protein n=1 Tax=hydrothermal vent metagenome TaxID=652676 RepID=A0A3B1DNR6_9ZZZZ